MSTPKKQSNVERGQWRTKCRETLAQHIKARVGISLDPAHVRLKTSREDAYSWHALPEKQHLFEKSLSDHSTGAYKELCEGAGITFEAIPRDTTEASHGQQTFVSLCRS
jgi:hypothetical protein